jgi:phosphate transport system substrate-binding protein
MSRLVKLAAIAGASALVLSGCAGAANEETATESTLSGTISGSGASSMGSGQEAWIAEFQIANPGVTINYDPSGSGAGREAFTAGGVVFAGTDSYWKDEELALEFAECAPGTKPWEFPVWISPIAVIFNLDGVDSLNLDAATVAGIFAGKITKWNDAAIASQNSGVKLPDLAITAVHRSDDSGTTKNFTDYLAKVAADIWADAGKPVGAIETWPAAFGGEGAKGTSGVVEAVKTGNGAIGYADASKAGDLGTVAIKVGSSYVSYSAEAASKVIEASKLVEGRESYDLAYKIARDTTVAGVYPIVLVSYLTGCNEYKDAATAELVKAYASYIISEQGQATAASAGGTAPISDSLREKAQAIIDAIK